MNVFWALLVVAFVGGLGGFGHGNFFTDAPATAKKESHKVKMVSGGDVTVSLRPNSILKEVLMGAISGLVLYGTVIAPGVELNTGSKVSLFLGPLVGVLLAGLAGPGYLVKTINDRQWTKVEPVYDKAEPEKKEGIDRNKTPAVVALRTLAFK